MKFLIYIRKEGHMIAKYPAIANDWFNLHTAAIDKYGPCSVSIVRQA